MRTGLEVELCAVQEYISVMLDAAIAKLAIKNSIMNHGSPLLLETKKMSQNVVHLGEIDSDSPSRLVNVPLLLVYIEYCAHICLMPSLIIK